MYPLLLRSHLAHLLTPTPICAAQNSLHVPLPPLPPAPPDYLFMWIVGAAFLLVVPPLFNYSLFFTCDPLINMAIYVWSKHNPDAPVR